MRRIGRIVRFVCAGNSAGWFRRVDIRSHYPGQLLPCHTVATRDALPHCRHTWCLDTLPPHVMPWHTAATRGALTHCRHTWCFDTLPPHVMPWHTSAIGDGLTHCRHTWWLATLQPHKMTWHTAATRDAKTPINAWSLWRTVVADCRDWLAWLDEFKWLWTIRPKGLFSCPLCFFPLSFLCSYHLPVSLSYFNIVVHMRKCYGEHSCMSYTFIFYSHAE